MKILITGGAGFIGSHLVDGCVARGDEVYILDNLITGSRENISHHENNTKVHFFEVDIRDWNKVQQLFSDIRPDVVFHLAAQINVRQSIKDPHYCMDVNILGIVNVLNAMQTGGCRRFIFSSTGGAMFSTDKPPYSESDMPSPNTPYGISKHCSEELIAFYSREYSLSSTILRYANVYGLRQDPRWEAGIVAIFLDHIKQGTHPVIFWDGEQTRDYVHVDDVVAANLHVLDKSIEGIYHVGTGIQTSVNTLWWICQKNIPNDLKPTYGPAVSEPRFVSLSIEKLMATGWAPRFQLESGITSLLQ